MVHTSLKRTAPLTQHALDTADVAHTVDETARAKRAANEAQILEERQVNPLWMITVALAVLFGLATLFMFA
jgi:hypothetical protein